MPLGLTGLDDDGLALIGFPDSLWDPVDGFRFLVEPVREGADVALGLFRSAGLEGADSVELDRSGRIVDIEVKPRHPRSDWIWGAAAGRVGALAGLDSVEWPSAFMTGLIAQGGEVRGVPLSDVYLDIGTPSSLRRITEGGWKLSEP